MKNGNLQQVIEGWNWSLDDYKSTPNGSLYREGGVLFSYGSHFPLAVHMGRYQLINADRYSNSTSKHQSYTIRECSNPVEIPFSALSAMISDKRFVISSGYQFNAKYLKDNMTILDHESDKWLHTGVFSKVDGHEYMTHVLGATLFTYTTDNKTRYILSGIDETGKGNNRYFMTELKGEPQTIEEAYEALKPDEVREAESNGIRVLRQGEWFFIPCDNVPSGEITKKFYLHGNEGDTGHHFASEGFRGDDGREYVRGIVKHEEGDHLQLKLYEDVKQKDWYVAYHNVQVNSFNAIGNVD